MLTIAGGIILAAIVLSVPPIIWGMLLLIALASILWLFGAGLVIAAFYGSPILGCLALFLFGLMHVLVRGERPASANDPVERLNAIVNRMIDSVIRIGRFSR